MAVSARAGTRRQRASLGRVAQRVLAWEGAPAHTHVDITLLSEIDPLPGESAVQLTERARREITVALAAS